MFGRWPSVETLHRIHDEWEDNYSDPQSRREKTHTVFGMKIVSEPVHPFEFGVPGAGKSLVLPDHPTRRQKWMAFMFLKFRRVCLVRRESQSIGYAFSHNAREIFNW